MSMKSEIKRRWVEALRSGKYTQGQRALNTIDSHGIQRFCCLGVLCDLAAKDGVVEAKQTDTFEVAYAGATKTLPSVVMEWAGLDDSNPAPRVADWKRRLSLAHQNDSGVSFSVIADLIEEGL